MQVPAPNTREYDLPGPEECIRLIGGRPWTHRLLAGLAVRKWWLMLTLHAATKRTLDIAGATAGLVLLFPLLLATALAIRIESPGPVLFRQERVGKRGRPFTMYKFRSMRVSAEAEKQALGGENESADGVLFKIKSDPRITRVGRLIRRLSIDELPQLMNVLRGDMSIVGPRPALPAEVDQYDREARKRLQAQPGLTCLWQISGRSELAFSEQVDLDIRYLGARSLAKDIAIIARTVPAVVNGKGAY
ncbi:MAG: sugar transferase [Gammaproteobacteria bacterium]|nr:sugar transferase [Gammaproteobacteria bacterium]